jgi:hypothetical protein
MVCGAPPAALARLPLSEIERRLKALHCECDDASVESQKNGEQLAGQIRTWCTS